MKVGATMKKIMNYHIYETLSANAYYMYKIVHLLHVHPRCVSKY